MTVINSTVGELPKMTWRGLAAPPYSEASFSGSFSLAERRYPYIDGASHENVGRDPMPMGFRLLFLNNLGKDLFPNLFQEWFNAVAIDKTPGKLRHPVYGLVWAMVKNWNVDVSADRTSGAILEVSFIESNPDIGLGTESLDVSIGNLRATAEAVDRDYRALEIPWPSGTSETSLLDIVKKIDSMAQMTRDTLEGYIEQSLGTVEAVIDSVESVGTNAKWALGGNVISFWNSLKDLAESAGIETRVIGNYAITQDSSFDRVSRETGNTVGELIGLNDSLLGSPKIPAGSVVRYYRDKEFNSALDEAGADLGV